MCGERPWWSPRMCSRSFPSSLQLHFQLSWWNQNLAPRRQGWIQSDMLLSRSLPLSLYARVSLSRELMESSPVIPSPVCFLYRPQVSRRYVDAVRVISVGVFSHVSATRKGQVQFRATFFFFFSVRNHRNYILVWACLQLLVTPSWSFLDGSSSVNSSPIKNETMPRNGEKIKTQAVFVYG